MYAKAILFSLTFLFLSQTGAGQSILEGYLQTGLENNLEIIKNNIRTSLAKEEATEIRQSYYPNLSFNSTYSLAGGGRKINIPAGDLVNPAYSALNQLTNSNQFPTDIANVNEQLLPNNFHDTRLILLQPIINTDLYYGYKIKQSQVSLSEAKEAAYENQLRFEIKRAYYSYLKTVKQKEILDSTRLLVKDLIRVNRKLVKNEVATKDIIYRSESQLNQVDAQIATINQGISTLRTNFNFLLNRDLQEEILIDEKILFSTKISNNTLTDFVSLALRERSELDQLDNARDISSLIKTKNEKYWMPDLSLSANLGFQGFGYKFNSDQAYALLGISLSMPLYQGNTNKIKIQKSMLDLELIAREYEQVKQQIELDVTRAYYVLQQNQKIYEAARFEVKNTVESHKIIKGRYRQGQSLLIELDEARNQMTTAKLSEVIAKYNVKIAEADLLRAMNI